LTTEEGEGFELLWIKEEYEEPVTLYLVCSRKKSKSVIHDILKLCINRCFRSIVKYLFLENKW
jgi:hypothetical protein